ncbi:MAG: lipid A export permease/ATP-binding protein MsbA [Gammaproteobacteria bacterium]|nr:lipid A export permease/ATP-binding protein MsbA [Gammaproteobacteria bacterium]
MAISNTSGIAVYWRLLRYARPYWKAFAIATLAMVFFAATETGFAALIKPLADGSFVTKDPAIIRMMPLWLVGLFLVRGIAEFISTYGLAWMGRKVVNDLRDLMFHHLMLLPAAFYDNNSSGQLLSKLIYDVEQVAQAATSAITVIVKDTLTVAGLVAWMLYLNALLALVFLLIGPFIAFLVLYINRRFRRISTRIQRSMGNITHVAEEAIGAQRVIKIFGAQHHESAQFERASEANRQLNMKMTATSASSTSLIQMVTASALAAIVYLATLDSMLASISVGTFMSFVAAMVLMLGPMKRITTINSTIQRGIAAAESVFAFLDSAAEPDTGTRSLARAQGAIEYRQVSFSYDESKGGVLHDISFKVQPGQTVALVGRSGSGKSTLVSLLPRFYNIGSGSITLDGCDIRDLRLADLRDQIALVSQEVTLFNATIAHNIAYGRLESASERDIIEAAEAAHAMEFIRPLPQGLNTLVGENGVLLSGGQRQRLAIARALLKNAPILILDEATSSLDTESERYIQAGLERLMRARTTLVIAHRLSTIEKADIIIVLHAGRIVEQGKHAELLARNGHYAALHKMQFRDNAATSTL